MEEKMENEMETGVIRYLSLSRVAYMSGHMYSYRDQNSESANVEAN